MEKIQYDTTYRLKRDRTLWKVFGFDGPLGMKVPELSSVLLEEVGGTDGMQVGESVFWEYFEKVT